MQQVLNFLSAALIQKYRSSVCFISISPLLPPAQIMDLSHCSDVNKHQMCTFCGRLRPFSIGLIGTKLLKSTDCQSHHSSLYECINIQKLLLSKQLSFRRDWHLTGIQIVPGKEPGSCLGKLWSAQKSIEKQEPLIKSNSWKRSSPMSISKVWGPDKVLLTVNLGSVL